MKVTRRKVSRVTGVEVDEVIVDGPVAELSGGFGRPLVAKLERTRSGLSGRFPVFVEMTVPEAIRLLSQVDNATLVSALGAGDTIDLVSSLTRLEAYYRKEEEDEEEV